MIIYRSAVEDDIDQIEALYRKHLDNGASLRSRLDRIFRTDTTCSAIAVDSEAGIIVGIAVYEYGLVLSCEHPDLRRSINADLGADALIYTGEALLIEPEYRKSGLAYELNRRIVSSLSAFSMELGKPVYVLHEMWVYPDGRIPAFNVVKDVYGIHRDYGILPEFYREYYQNGHLCPICGENCICSARITVSKI